MGARKIVNEQEVIKWFGEGRTGAWMSDQYMRRYGVETTPSTWSNFRRRRGLDRKNARVDNLIPWEVAHEHRWKYAVKMLRFEGRQREGMPLKDADAHQLENFHAYLDGNNPWGLPVVVHYDAELDAGFVFVPREAGDTDIIRQPVASARTQRRSGDR